MKLTEHPLRDQTIQKTQMYAVRADRSTGMDTAGFEGYSHEFQLAGARYYRVEDPADR